MVDDKDLGCRPEHETLLALADKLDELKLSIERQHAPQFEAAKELLQKGQREAAAALYEIIAASFTTAGLPLEATYWLKRARDCRKAARPAKGRNR